MLNQGFLKTRSDLWMDLLRRATAICIAAILTAQIGAMSANAQQIAPVQAPATQTPAAQPSDTTTPTAPLQSAPVQQAPGTVPAPATPAGTNQPPSGTPAPEQQTTTPAPPVGTAAAPYEKGVGVAASRPAGVVIAPAKQRRTRSFLIKVGVILAAAAAVGTIVGLSSASPSRQPH